MSERHSRLDEVCRSKADGSLWRATVPPGYELGHAVADVIVGTKSFYFREVRRVHRRWLPGYWKDTGEVWEPASGEFTVLTEAAAIRMQFIADQGEAGR